MAQEKDNPDFCTLDWYKDEELLYPQVKQWRCIADLSGSKLTVYDGIYKQV